MPERVEARAPTRIDLAGGTLDIWPLHLLHERPLTVNAAIDIYARARVEAGEGRGVEVVAADRGARARYDSLAHLEAAIDGAPPELEFLLRLAAHFLARGGAAGGGRGCRITTDCQAPAGSGLGGSSTLGIALAAALGRFAGDPPAPERLLAVTRAIETQVLRIPTGEQDYHPAIHGGVLALHYTVEGTRVERLPVDAGEIERRIVLVDSGVSRSSGLSNWDMFKRHLDGDGGVRAALERVNRAAHALHHALLRGDWDGAGTALGAEWEARQALSPAVTTPGIERLITGARQAGGVAGKVCGAGGGGCLILWTRPEHHGAVRARASALGGRVLDYRIATGGLEVTES